MGYLFLQMPQSTFLAVVIYSASTALYPHYATTGRTWGPSVLEDQQAAGALMWVWGDLTFLVALLLVLAAWWRAEEAKTTRLERRIDAERAAVAVGSAIPIGDQPGGSGVARYSRYRSGSTLPPDTTATTGPDTPPSPASRAR
jgi:hypothetical protein